MTLMPTEQKRGNTGRGRVSKRSFRRRIVGLMDILEEWGGGGRVIAPTQMGAHPGMMERDIRDATAQST